MQVEGEGPGTDPFAAEKEANQVRFETELEFVQCLANPFYLQCEPFFLLPTAATANARLNSGRVASALAQQGLLADESFLNYLNYLKYWHQPRFARFIQYPQSLHLLDLLTHPSGTLREQLLTNQNLGQDLAGKQLAHWAGWRENGIMKGGGAKGTENGISGKEKETGAVEIGVQNGNGNGHA
ncbi:mediator of RNA polymerase II transcription subunit 31, partial [Phenoliferia sp. Uapishka_3]